MNTVEVSDVTAWYRRGGGVKAISFSAEPGEWIALFGAAGSGKTTLLRLLAGRLAPDSGSVRLLGRAPRSAARQVGYVPEGTPGASLFTPHQILGQRMARHDVPGLQRPARMAEMLDLFGLYEDRDRPARELSHGQQGGLALAAGLIHRPAVLLLDNVTATLPRPLADRLRAHLDARRAADRLTVIHATTSSAEAEQSDRVLLLEAGCPRAFADPEDLLSRCSRETMTVEAADPAAVQRTLRGIFDVEVLETRDGLRFSAADGVATAAHLFRHPAGGVRVVYLHRPDLWDVLAALPDAAGSRHEKP